VAFRRTDQTVLVTAPAPNNPTLRRIAPSDPAAVGRRLTRGLVVAPGQGLALSFLALIGLGLLAVSLYVLALTIVVVGLALFPIATAVVRWWATLNRLIVGFWLGEAVPRPYRSRISQSVSWRHPWAPFVEVVRDPATWRDLLWLFTSAIPIWVLTLLPAALIALGLWGVLIPFVWQMAGQDGSLGFYVLYYVDTSLEAWVSLLIGAAVLTLAVWANPRLVDVALRHGAGWLRPTRSAQLASRVARLTETRLEAVDTQAAELRRIERDLHDGAQARLVSLGLSLGTAEALLEKDPAAARALLAEARTTSSKALEELRGLVRGIHPPVLADRGLGDAVRALALDSPLEVSVSVRFSGALEGPVESAAYFATAELLTNASKHAEAEHLWVDLRHVDGQLRVTVLDDGVGGADRTRGTGLHGIERRLATFDGTLDVSSPVGGPTCVTLEIPCVLSSPRTSSS